MGCSRCCVNFIWQEAASRPGGPASLREGVPAQPPGASSPVPHQPEHSLGTAPTGRDAWGHAGTSARLHGGRREHLYLCPGLDGRHIYRDSSPVPCVILRSTEVN